MMEKQWHPRSNISIFLSALHLLDLDTLPNWPSITSTTFETTTNKSTSQSLQARIKATEWTLYQLFHLYSPESTRQTLSPNFPPTTPVKSLNLRAGLYKLLTELKKNGVLPRETVLRKTMLDECKGEKFEELLAGFSMVVLRKTLASGGLRESRVLGKPKATSLRTHDLCKPPKPEHVIPLLIAHRVFLQNKLQQRQKLCADAKACSEFLSQHRADLASRLEAISRPEDNADDDEEVLSNDNDLLHEKVAQVFAADPRWTKFVFEGGAGGISSASLPEQAASKWPFSGETQILSTNEPFTAVAEATEPFRQLQTLISHHQDRRQHLEALKTSLLSGSTSAPMKGPKTQENTENMKSAEKNVAPPTPASIQGLASPPRFARHQALNLNSVSV